MLDTNVLISLFVFPTEHINQLKRNIVKHQIVICSYVVDETKDVVGRKFPNRMMDLDVFFQSFPFVMPYTPVHFDASDYPTIRDEFDLPVLVSAIQEDVDILITGDKETLINSGVRICRGYCQRSATPHSSAHFVRFAVRFSITR